MERFKVGFSEAYSLPRRVRSYLLLYASLKDAELADRQRQAEQQARAR